ncbi:IS110 family transposase [Williamsia herbipolensis]|uniref:IS110 family transposase n=1 Tax=Williamsia herbipolensis TaxID=1603258 RepID=UPI0005F7817C|nr:IS110 family transposase [Williamsia herbipolensis]MCX6471855.1 IS110 family transposase [Mycobacteriales bacterium]
MHVIGIDPHKLSHTATSVEPSTNTDLGSRRVPSSLEGYQQLLDWSAAWPDRVWAIENAKGLGHHFAQWLIQAGETVVDVPSTATARVRELSRGGRRKTDRIDAAAAACVAFTQADYRPVEADGDRAIIRLLDERRTDVANQHSRVVNQLHAVLRELLPGGVATNQSVEKIRRIVIAHEPVTPADVMRRTIALEIVGDLLRLRFQIDELTDRITTALEASGSTLTAIHGVGPICAARLVARIGNPARFASEAAFASYVGTAPIDVSSGDHNRHRLSRSGDRKLNAVIHIIAVSQSRHPSAPGYQYYRRKINEGKTRREAQRCLKRQITKQIWKTMQSDTKQETLSAA